MKNYVVLLLTALMFTLSAYSQCGPYTATATAADCPSSGSITISPANATSYQITTGPATGGYSTGAQSSNIFNALPAGAYTITVTCNGTAYSVNATVANNYTRLDETISVTNVCTDPNRNPGGTITVTGSGGRGAYRYAVLMSNDAATADNLFTYGTTNVFTVTAFGTYQVRIKDDCNNFVTKSIQVLPIKQIVGLSAPAWTYDCNAATSRFFFPNNSGVYQSLTGDNYLLEIWYNASSTTCSGSPTGSPNYSTVINSSYIDLTLLYTYQSAFWRITTPCGETKEGCITIPRQPALTVNTKVDGCAAGTNYFTFAPSGGNTVSFPYTVTVNVYDANNALVGSVTKTVTNTSEMTFTVPYGQTYSYTISDACRTVSGNTYTTYPLGSNIVYNYMANCPNLSPVNLTINVRGYLPDISQVPLANITLVNTSTNQAYPAFSVTDDASTSWIVFNSVPAPGTYTIKIDVPDAMGNCDVTFPVLNVPAPAAPVIKTLDIGGTVTQLCGGSGTINATSSGTLAASMITYTLKQGSTLITSNTVGTFANLAPGTYTVTASGTDSRCGQNVTITSSKDFIITPDGSLPVVLNKYGINCDASATASVSMALAGFGPFKVEMKLSTEPESSFVVKATGVTDVFTLTGLAQNTVYDVRITDNCGKAYSTQVTTQDLPVLNLISANQQPCVGSNYTLSVTDIPGATYVWKRDGLVMGNGPSLNFTPYKASDDATYTVTMTYGSCITRTYTVKTNSLLCGQALSVNFGSITATIKNGILNLSWTSLTEKNNAMYEVEISKDGQHFYSIGSLPTKAEGGNSTGNIEYSFSTPLSKALAGTMSVVLLGLVSLVNVKRRKKLMLLLIGFVTIAAVTVSCNKEQLENLNTDTGNVYVRIATIDKDGVKSYSKIVKAIQK